MIPSKQTTQRSVVAYKSNRPIGRQADINIRRSLTDFEHVILAYIALSPQSGYSLKQRFASSPATVYNPSPGALYPALRRLLTAGLLSAEDAVSSGQRSRRMYRLTESGRAAHDAWLHEPVDKAEAASQLGLHIMRFANMQDTVERAHVLKFLQDLADGLESFIEGTKSYLATEVTPDRVHATLALEHGIAVHQASLDWARATHADLSGRGEFSAEGR